MDSFKYILGLLLLSITAFGLIFYVRTAIASESTDNAFPETPQDALSASVKKSSQLIPSIYDFTVQTIEGEPKALKDYRGQALLIVNTASLCGYTPQYRSLEELYQRFKARGFTVLAFPANNFLNQEPGNNAEIKNFCFRQYKTSFPLFSKISVKGEDIHPLYAFLTSGTKFPGPITWNFNKFLVNPKGEVIARFETPIDPLSPDIIQTIERNLPTP
ncbi:MAG TPA: glutathione peroxidase [Candidatus Omnitrophota bacterium]|jgi:glutathione peroxidase|nr:glutathione peroxidase [Candidatus Omnitrophota bacterium]HPN57469.1 glutathione peroxidase [Candidatus Omnitrophota bacterium]